VQQPVSPELGTRQGADELADVIFQSISSQPSKDEVDTYHVCSHDSFWFFYGFSYILYELPIRKVYCVKFEHGQLVSNVNISISSLE
jgi:hypothetical protein